jgi:beta-carotene 3-hydroxylase
MEAGEIVICALVVTGTFLFWELIAWFTHKYIMHGFLWCWHRSHHTAHDHQLEKNDLFALVFSLPCIALFYYYTKVDRSPYIVSAALGIFFYGVFYFVFHDVIVHQRLKWRPRKQSRYLQRIVHAHSIHHSRHSRHGSEAFGFLYAPKKYAPKKYTFKRKTSETQ